MCSIPRRRIRVPLVATPALVAALVLWPAAASGQAEVPRVTFAITPLLDRYCTGKTGAPADTAAAGHTGGGPVREASVRAELQAQIGELNAAWHARDRAALERIHAPEFVWVHGFGFVDDRATHIEERLELLSRTGGAPPIQLSFDPPNRLLVYGDVAILRAPNPGRGSGPVWGTTIYAREEGRWQIVQIQGTELNPERVAVPVDPAVLDAYAGRYDRGDGSHSEVAREGDALVVRHPALPKRTLTPVAENRFFDKGGNEYTFHRGADGRVTHVVIRMRTGEELRRDRVPS